jgi:uncharacterized membrane protein
LWFLPTLIVIASAICAAVLVEIDSRLSGTLLVDFPRLFGAGAEGSRGMLSSIASSMITVAGVTFSIIIVALSQASSQYSSRILRNFMRDRANQSVLGVFLGIFTYCLIVLRAIRSGDEGRFVPSLSVFGGVVLAFVAIGFLIFFIHHVASSLQASNVIAAAAAETLGTIDRLFPETLKGEEISPEGEAHLIAALEERPQTIIPAPASGYIQSNNEGALARMARSSGSVIRALHSVGDFVVADTPFVVVYSASSPDKKLVRDIQSAYSINSLRSIEQDVSFGIRQIVDIALKALSTGMNDTTTALTCVDYLTVINVRLATRRITQRPIFANGELRVVPNSQDFETLIGESFDEIRANAAGNAVLILRLLNSFKTIAGVTDDASRKNLIREHICFVEEMAKETIDS